MFNGIVPDLTLIQPLATAHNNSLHTTLSSIYLEYFSKDEDDELAVGLALSLLEVKGQHQTNTKPLFPDPKPQGPTDTQAMATCRPQNSSVQSIGSVSHFMSCCQQNPAPGLGVLLDPPILLSSPSVWPGGCPLKGLGLALMPQRKDGTTVSNPSTYRQIGVYMYEKESGQADAPNTSCLSPYLHFGRLSARWLLWDAKGACCQPPKFIQKLAWRDLAYWQLTLFPDLPWEPLRPPYKDTLVDADGAIDAMMWQNGGMCGLDHWNFVMHPVDATMTCDPNGNYVRTWCPELPDDLLHKPWKCPTSMLHYAVLPRACGDRSGGEERRSQSLQDVALMRRRFGEYVDLVPLPLPPGLGGPGYDPDADAASNPYNTVLKSYVSRRWDETIAFLNQTDFMASVMNEGAEEDRLPRPHVARGRVRRSLLPRPGSPLCLGSGYISQMTKRAGVKGHIHYQYTKGS
ncbi:unnamed protein product [Coregonus sp. 'balchen']|nr:unnamed protein product [Coregonus sp. 'balchen']